MGFAAEGCRAVNPFYFQILPAQFVFVSHTIHTFFIIFGYNYSRFQEIYKLYKALLHCQTIE